MSLKIRLARAGAKKRPYYRIVVADSKSPRDGRYIEKIGTYDPLLPKGGEQVKLVEERVKHWLGVDRKSTRLNSSHMSISYAVFCLKKKKKNTTNTVIKNKKATRTLQSSSTTRKINDNQIRRSPALNYYTQSLAHCYTHQSVVCHAT